MLGWALFLLFALLATIMAIAWFYSWKRKVKPPLSLYTGFPLRRLLNASYDTLVQVHRFLDEHPGYDNPNIRFSRALFCRDTGRIFPECVNWYGSIDLDWTFLRKRYPGHYVSWGSLSQEQKREIKELHGSLEGFQTEFSCPDPLPQQISPEYAYRSPGPLYVDISTHTLLGWKEVPDTQMEVLIVQKPRPSALETETRPYE